MYIVRFLNCHDKHSAFWFVNPLSPPVCPSNQEDNTILKGRDIISQFLRYSAQLLISAACYISYYAMCFFNVCFSGPCSLMGLGAGFWRLRLLLTFACSWKEPFAPAGGVEQQPIQTAQRSSGLHGPPPWWTCGLKVWRKHVHFVSYCTAWVILSVNIIGFVVSGIMFLKSREDLRAIWCDILVGDNSMMDLQNKS